MKLCLVNVFIFIDDKLPLQYAIVQARISMTTVLTAVARSESTFFIPILAKIAVKAANNADSKAYIHHILISLSVVHLFPMHSFQYIKCTTKNNGNLIFTVE